DGSFRSAFTTADDSPPPRPPAGQISLSIPRDGTTEVRGLIGSVDAGDLVSVLNLSRGTTTSVVAGPDGAFFATVDADPGDEIRLLISRPDGAASFLDPIPFSDVDGTTLLGPRGGALASAAGVRASVLPGALLADATLRLRDLAVDCDGDALPDLFAAGGASPARTFRNRSELGGDIAFALGEVPELTGVTGARPLDIAGDGWFDLTVLRVGPRSGWSGRTGAFPTERRSKPPTPARSAAEGVRH
ncbi:MAG TPA: hypothetical protein PKA98_21375, partial [Acidimicrobiales bacterium]|nr:hypothetical protein [Acidimicrobiales bacterium]